MAPDELFPPPEPGLDAAVRGHLDAEAARTDPAALWTGLAKRLDAPPAVPALPRRRTWLAAVPAAVAALAAGLLVAFLIVPPSREAAANPANVVEAARNAHAAPVDRCYGVSLELPPTADALLAKLIDTGRKATLCTRGDRFVVTPGFAGKGAWGRDADGRVWVAPNRTAAARFPEAELPLPIQGAVRVRGLRLPTLLDEVLKNFDLARTSPDGEPARVTATRRGDALPFALAAADLVIEPGTNVVTKLTLRRKLPTGGEARLIFTYEGPAEKDEAAYTAEGNLAPNAPVYDGDRPGLRARVLAVQLGGILKNGL